MTITSKIQMRAFLDSLPTTSYGNIDCTNESVLQSLKDNGFVIIDHKDNDGRTYTGKKGFFGMDDSSVGSTSYSRYARPDIRAITFDGEIPECTQEEQEVMDAEAQKYIGEYMDNNKKATITSISYIEPCRYNIVSSTPILSKNTKGEYTRIRKLIDDVWTEVDVYEGIICVQ